MTLNIPAREGLRPETTSPGIPHKQRTQNAPAELQEKLWQRLLALPRVQAGPSPISGPGTRAVHLERAVANGPKEAFAPDGGTEFAHIHDSDDGSLHVTLARPDAEAVLASGWGEWHPTVLMGIFPPNLVMVYGPRTVEEIDVIDQILAASHAHATGERRRPAAHADGR